MEAFARNAIVGALLALAVAGCASGRTAATADGSSPSASIGEGLRPLAGHWRGAIWETGGWYSQGQIPIEVRITEDGLWAGTIGKNPASGTARRRGRWLEVSGTMRTPEGRDEPIYITLKGDDRELWGETRATFAGRRERTSVSLEKDPN